MALLRHLALRCRDMERSRRFYEEVIGFRFIDYRPSRLGIDLSDGTCNLTLLQHADDHRQRQPEGEEFIHFGLVVDDLEAVWKRLSAWGARFSRESVKDRNPIAPGTVPPVSFKVLDPDGNVIDITRNEQEWRGVNL